MIIFAVADNLVVLKAVYTLSELNSTVLQPRNTSICCNKCICFKRIAVIVLAPKKTKGYPGY